MKKIISLLLVIVMCFSIAVPAFAENSLNRVASTIPGTDIEYNYVENVTVQIPGTEVTFDFEGIAEFVFVEPYSEMVAKKDSDGNYILDSDGYVVVEKITYDIPVYTFTLAEECSNATVQQNGEWLLAEGNLHTGDGVSFSIDKGTTFEMPLLGTDESENRHIRNKLYFNKETYITSDGSFVFYTNPNDIEKNAVAKVVFDFLNPNYGGFDEYFDEDGWYYNNYSNLNNTIDISEIAITSNYTGLEKRADGNWYYVVDGIVDYDYTGLVKHTNGIWYYVEDGVLDWGHSGLWKHNGTWYYVEKGQINWKFNGLVKHTNGTWYYVQGAKLNWGYTGLVKHNTGSWFYVQKGQINFDYTGLVKHSNGIWYYIENGKLDWGYSGLWKHNGTWYYVQKGQINWKCNGLVKHTNGIWYYVQGAKLNWNYTGLVKHTNNKWYYVQKGQINFNYTGYVTHNGIRYKVVNGVKV